MSTASTETATGSLASLIRRLMMRYEVDVLVPRFWTRTLPPERLAKTLNDRAGQGWIFLRSITDSRRKWLIFRRDAHFLIFQRSD